MITYALKHNTYFNEDILSSIVFETMNYLPHDFCLLPFLQHLKKTNKNIKLPDSPVKMKLQEPLEVPEQLQKLLGQNTVIPDVILHTEDNDWVMLIEAELSKEIEPDQILAQLAVASWKYSTPNLYFLLVNASMTPPVIGNEQTLRDYLNGFLPVLREKGSNKNDYQILISHVYWTNWQHFHILFRKTSDILIKDESIFSPGLKRLGDSICELLDHYDLGSIESLDVSKLKPVNISSLMAILPKELLIGLLTKNEVVIEAVQELFYNNLIKWLRDQSIKAGKVEGVFNHDG